MNWRRFPYTTLSILCYSFFRFPGIYESLIMGFFYAALRENGYSASFVRAAGLLFTWIAAMKFCKIAGIFGGTHAT